MEKKIDQMKERAAGLVVGTSLVVAGFFLIVLGLTFLPVIGIFAGMAVASLSIYFLFPHPAEVSTKEEQPAKIIDNEGRPWCRWPPVAHDRAA